VHKAVLLNEALEHLNLEDKKIVVDCTIGGAGHAREILMRLGPDGMLIGIDADKEALAIAEERLKGLQGAFRLAHENFRDFDKVLRNLKIDKVDGMLFDLGVSSFQLEDERRGFSFSGTGVLDMRMDTEKGSPLWQVLNRLNEDELARIIKDLGEERYWRRVAKAIVSERRNAPIKETTRLAEIIRKAIPRHRWERIDPATRTFQALRIYINDELNALGEALDKVPDFLNKGSSVAVVSFHSLEDRIVKNRFKEFAKKVIFEILTKKPIRPTEAEVEENPRSRSAKLRAARRI
jgi:16S rRNA (cytosine1402-N4)-methyltransferase